jgi:hypothetical protein
MLACASLVMVTGRRLRDSLKQPQTQEVNAMNHRYRSYRKAPTFPLLEIGIGLTLSVVLLGIALTS